MLSQWLCYSLCLGYAGARNRENIGGIMQEVSQRGKLMSHIGGLESFLVIVNNGAHVFIGVHDLSHLAEGGAAVGEVV